MSRQTNEKRPERSSSPEQLDRYLKVTSVKLWIVIAAVIVVLAGIIVFGCTAKLELKVNTVVEVVEDTAVFYVKSEDFLSVEEGDKVRLENGDEGVVLTIYDKATTLSKETFGEFFMSKGNYQDGEVVFAGLADMPDGHGIYSGVIVIGETNSFAVW